MSFSLHFLVSVSCIMLKASTVVVLLSYKRICLYYYCEKLETRFCNVHISLLQDVVIINAATRSCLSRRGNCVLARFSNEIKTNQFQQIHSLPLTPFFVLLSKFTLHDRIKSTSLRFSIHISKMYGSKEINYSKVSIKKEFC